MHSAWFRGNAVFFFGLAVLAVMSIACAYSTSLISSDPQVNELEVTDVLQLVPHGPWDRARLTFTVDANLSSEFNWNVKQLFAFVTVEYTTDKNVLNQVVVWDKIIRNPSEAKFRYENQSVKYALMDQGTELRGRDITLRLSWDVMPLTGSMHTHHGKEVTARLPAEYMNPGPRHSFRL